METINSRKQSDWDRKNKPTKKVEEKPKISHHKGRKQKYVRHLNLRKK